MISPRKVEKAASYKQLHFKIDRIFHKHVYFVQNEIECNIDYFSNGTNKSLFTEHSSYLIDKIENTLFFYKHTLFLAQPGHA